MGRTQKNIRLNDEQKAEWEDHADESPHYNSVSELIRVAVRNQIERDRGDVEGGADDGETALDGFDIPASGEVLDRIQELRNDIQDLDTDVRDALTAVHAQSWVDEDTQFEIFEALPEGEENALTAEEIADMDYWDLSTVKFALENMARNDMPVVKTQPVEPVDDGEYGVETAPRYHLEEGAF